MWSTVHLPHPLFLSSFFTDPSTTEIYTLSLHDALPIFLAASHRPGRTDRHEDLAVAVHRLRDQRRHSAHGRRQGRQEDRKSTRLNSSHVKISYAVFCLKKKKKTKENNATNRRHSGEK